MLGQEQVVIKSIKENMEQTEGIAGATILGDGNVALILDIPNI
ncbi:chemotaxis protein CheW [Anaerobacillus sp. HL2]|nr:chemotaxis protein CheW [Anaerobacillus sp. HL2]